MNKQQLQLIADNPNLSSAAIARLIGVHKSTVDRSRSKPLWKHSGVGIPYMYESVNEDGVYKSIRFGGRVLSKGKLDSAMENLGRLIYCLENNDGKLPMTTEQSILSNLNFIKVDIC
jgi:hypothetical protein